MNINWPVNKRIGTIYGLNLKMGPMSNWATSFRKYPHGVKNYERKYRRKCQGLTDESNRKKAIAPISQISYSQPIKESLCRIAASYPDLCNYSDSTKVLSRNSYMSPISPKPNHVEKHRLPGILKTFLSKKNEKKWEL